VQDRTAVQDGQVVTDQPSCSGGRGDWSATDDTAKPNTPTSLGLSKISGNTPNYTIGNTDDVDISSDLTPATATDTPAYARIMARISNSWRVSVANQLVVLVEVSRCLVPGAASVWVSVDSTAPVATPSAERCRETNNQDQLTFCQLWRLLGALW